MTLTNSIKGTSNKTLVLVRTPFQAWQVKQVLKAEKVSTYDLLYFTQNDSAEDRHYYDRLAANACAAKYIFISKQVRDVLNHIRFACHASSFVFGACYEKTFVASIDSYVLNAIANRAAAGDLITFDDGTANFNQSGAYFNDVDSWKAQLYRWLFRASSITAIRAKIKRHYTIHPALKNIVETDRLLPLTGWERQQLDGKPTGKPKVYFIGAPFRESLTSHQLHELTLRVKRIGVDVYVRHPREDVPIDLNVPFLEKRGKIAEEAILNDARGRPIVLVGSPSTVMFNLASCTQERLIFMPSGSQRRTPLTDLARLSSCEITRVEELG